MRVSRRMRSDERTVKINREDESFINSGSLN